MKPNKILSFISIFSLFAASIFSVQLNAQSSLDDMSAQEIGNLSTQGMSLLLSELAGSNLKYASDLNIQNAVNSIMAVVTPTGDTALIESVARTIAEALFLQDSTASEISDLILNAVLGSGATVNQTVANSASDGTIAGIREAALSMGMSEAEVDALINSAFASGQGQAAPTGVPGAATVPTEVSYDG